MDYFIRLGSYGLIMRENDRYVNISKWFKDYDRDESTLWKFLKEERTKLLMDVIFMHNEVPPVVKDGKPQWVIQENESYWLHPLLAIAYIMKLDVKFRDSVYSVYSLYVKNLEEKEKS